MSEKMFQLIMQIKEFDDEDMAKMLAEQCRAHWNWLTNMDETLPRSCSVGVFLCPFSKTDFFKQKRCEHITANHWKKVLKERQI